MTLCFIQPEIMLITLAVAVLLRHAFRPFKRTDILGYSLAIVVGLLFFASFGWKPADGLLFQHLYRLDAFAIFGKRLFLLITALVLVISAGFSKRLESSAEFYVIILFAATGMLFLCAAHDFIFLFVALELVTISFYIMTSYLRRQIPSLEAGTKYLIMGALSGGLSAYGIAYIFGATGSTHFDRVAAAVAGKTADPGLLLIGAVFLLVGLFFKISAVPGQMWTPDVYQGAPTPVTAFLATGSKAAGFIALMRVLNTPLAGISASWIPLLLVISGLTILYGNLGALRQTSLKRLLGYSSIAHAGYLLMGVSTHSIQGSAAVLYYLVQYAFTLACGFLALTVMMADRDDDRIESMAGLFKRSPLLAASLSISMLSLAGLPPLSGFFGKFLLFLAAIRSAQINPHYLTLACVALAGAVISLYFYFGVVRTIYRATDFDASPISVHPFIRLVLWLCIAAVILLGIFQSPLLDAATRAVKSW